MGNGRCLRGGAPLRRDASAFHAPERIVSNVSSITSTNRKVSRAVEPSIAPHMVGSEKRRPLVIVATDGEWAGRSLESVLELNGYSVLRSTEGRRALELARRIAPDGLIIDETLSDMRGVDVARALRDDPLFDHATPIVITAEAPVSTGIRAGAFTAGAWELCTHPIDIDTLLLKLATFMRAKHEAEVAHAKALVDRMSGLYSVHGLQQWARQLGARATRNHEAFACVAVMPATSEGAADSTWSERSAEELAHVAELWRMQSRRSDVIGHLNESRLAILAPDTDAPGALRLVERLRGALEDTPIGRGENRSKSVLRAGYAAVSDLAAAAVEPLELMRRAERALEYAFQAHDAAVAALSFDELPAT